MKRIINATLMVIALSLLFGTNVKAQTIDIGNGILFDSDYYAANNPDVMAIYGNDFDALLVHYITTGIKEGRMPSACTKKMLQVMSTQQAMSAQSVTVTASNQPVTGLVPINKLANRRSLQKKMTNAEFQAAYNAASNIVTPLLGKSREEQLAGIASAIRNMADSGAVQYTTSVPHYNDPYGYFVTGVGSCAGETRAIGLCLNMLGIPYEHVNENQWSHQWCRVPMQNGTFWIVDAYGLYVGVELAPYQHPNA